jgi:3-oxoadipate enol-lactonase
MQMVRSNGINLHCRVEGPADGQAVVFANSLGTDFRVFDALPPLMQGKLRIIRYDKRGHGLSDATPAPYKLADHVADLAGLLDVLGVKQAVLVGLSIGGLITQGLSAVRPDLIRAAVLMDTAHKIGTDELWNTRIDNVRKAGIESIADAVMERWFSPAFRKNRVSDLAGWRNMLTRTSAEGYLGSCAAIRDVNYEREARAMRIPVLGIGGSLDLATPPDLVKGTNANIPKARFEQIEGVGHLPPAEAPEQAAAMINRFLRENGIG